MVSLASLWLPVLVSAVIVFFASFLAWMVLPHHKPDWKTLPDEGRFVDLVRSFGLSPGIYLFPFCTPKDMEDEEKRKRWEAGPHGVMLVAGGRPNFGRNLAIVFLFFVVVAFFAAYVGSLALPAGATYHEVFRLISTVAIGFFALGMIPNAVFYGRTLRAVAMDILDGFVYALLMAGVFGWLWPTAV